MGDGLIAEAMWRFAGAWPGWPGGGLGLEALGKAPVAAMLQQLSGTVVERRFVDGGFVGRWPFAIVVRVNGEETAGRLGALEMIQGIRRWMESEALPGIGQGRLALCVEMTGLPSMAAAYPDGTEAYQAVFALKYKEDGRYGG